ncbi:RhuM family protein [Photobacterium sp. Alg240-V54]|uniref:RhuM family protein n=1 Tax=Photobacterium sp. Alg240-V54 TaxID=2305995 RepID=UPI0013D5B101|nr:RhuM family protein [Photobacterium sp. Alg240-V54]
MNNNELIIYTDEGYDAELVLIDGKPWANQETVAEIFSTTVTELAPLLRDIFKSQELDVAIHAQQLSINSQNDKDWFVSVDAIISVGYRINARKATQFRQWSTNIITKYLRDGFVLNEDILKSDPQKLNELAAKIRELRANEKSVYASVRECFKIAASDYSPSSKEVRLFYALLQDKFHHAITRMSASQLILDRANYNDNNMGLQTFKGAIPSAQEALIGKNYLSEIEMYRMYLISEQFLLFAETTALSNQFMTMGKLHKKLDELLIVNGYEVFDGYADSYKQQAKEHAQREYERFIEIKKLEILGLNVDLVSFDMGEYDEYKIETAKISKRQLNKALSVLPH